MANIPIYNQPKVADKHIANNYNSVKLTDEMFDTSAQVYEKTGKLFSNLATIMQQKQEDVEKTKIVDFTNKLDAYANSALYDKENGYFYQTGENAMNKTDIVMSDYRKFGEKLIKEAKLSSNYEQIAKATLENKFNSTFSKVAKHDYDETTNWQNNVYSQKLNNFTNQGVMDRNNEANLVANLNQAINVIDLQADLQKWDNATKQAKINEYKSLYHISVINALLADGSLLAKQYYEKNKENISAEKQTAILNAINGNELNYTANKNAEYMFSLSLDDAYKYLDSIENIYEKNATESAYNRLLNRQENIVKQKDNQISQELMNNFYSVMQTGSPDEVRNFMQTIYSSGLSIDMQDKMLDKIKTYNELGQFLSNWGHKQYLEDLAFYNAEEFKTINLSDFDLAKTEFEHFSKMQREIGSVEYNNEKAYKDVIKKLNTSLFGICTDQVPNQEAYKSEIFKIFNKIEQMQGSAFNLKDLDSGEVKNLLDAFNYKSENQDDKSIDEWKELYIQGKQYAEFNDIVAQNYQRFKLQNKKEPSPEEMYNMTLSSYNNLLQEKKLNAKTQFVNGMNLYTNVNNTLPKIGETKVLTYFVDKEIPRLSEKLNLRLNYVDGARYRRGDIGGHGKGRKFDLSMSEHSQTNRVRIMEEVLSNPLVLTVGTSDKLLLERFKGNKKIIDLRNWDLKEGTKKGSNHVNHLDITLNTRFGGTVQGLKDTQRTITMQRPDGKIVNLPEDQVEKAQKEYKYVRL